MKLFIPIFLFLLSFNTFAVGEEREKLTYEVLDQIGILQFTEQIKKIKKYKSIEEIDELDYQLKWYYENLKFWYYFDHEDFEKGLFKKLAKNFKKRELKEIRNIFRNPFYVKALKAMVLNRDIFKFHKQCLLTDTEPGQLVKSRFSLVKNLYMLHGMSIQKEVMEDRQKDFVDSGRTSISIIDKKNGKKLFINPTELKKRYENSENYIINYIGAEITSFRHYEMREYLRVMKKSIVLQRFLQLYTNYHFLYMTKYLDKIQQDKLDALRIVQPAKS